MRDPMKPRNLTDIPNPTFGAMVRALLRGEAKTLGEAYRQLEGAMKYTKAERLEMVLAGWKATPPHLDGNDWSRADQSYWFDRLDEVLHGDEGRGATSFGAAVLSARALLAALQPAEVRPSPAILAAAHEVQRCAEIEGGAMETADAGVALARLVLAEVRPDEPAPPEVRGEVEHVPTSSGKRKVLMAYLPDDAPFGNRESVTVRIVPGGGR